MAAPQQPPQSSQPIGFDPYGNDDDTQREKFPINAAVHQGNQKDPGFVSRLSLMLETLDKILTDQKTKANGTVRMEMPLSANLVINSTEPGKQDMKNYDVVLTWGGDSNFDQKHAKCLLLDILSETQWKMNLQEAQNGAKEDSERGNVPMESAGGEQSASYISGLKRKLETLDKTLKDLRMKYNGAFRMKMPLAAMVVDSTDESGKCPAVCAQHDVRNYEVVLTWGDDSDDLGHKRRKCVLHDILFETNWKLEDQQDESAGGRCPHGEDNNPKVRERLRRP